MKAIRLLVVVVLGAGALVLSGAGPALACSCAVSSWKSHVENAHVIVTGTIAGIEGPPHKHIMSSSDPVTYTIDVDRIFKGDSGTKLEFTSAVSGASCGLEGMQIDRRYTFFLSSTGKGLDASLCGGTAPTSQSLNSGVARWTGPPGLPQIAEPAQTSAISTATDKDTPAQPAWPVWMVGLGAGLVIAAGAAGRLLWRRMSR